jgi:hypothetical protein
METRGINKFEGILIMRSTCLPIVESCKVEGKLLVILKIVQIM